MNVAILTAKTPDMHPQGWGCRVPLGTILSVKTDGQIAAKWLEMLCVWADPTWTSMYEARPFITQLRAAWTVRHKHIWNQYTKHTGDGPGKYLTDALAGTGLLNTLPQGTLDTYPWCDGDKRRYLIVSGHPSLPSNLIGLKYARPGGWKFWTRTWWTKSHRGNYQVDITKLPLDGDTHKALISPYIAVEPMLDVTLTPAHLRAV